MHFYSWALESNHIWTLQHPSNETNEPPSNGQLVQRLMSLFYKLKMRLLLTASSPCGGHKAESSVAVAARIIR